MSKNLNKYTNEGESKSMKLKLSTVQLEEFQKVFKSGIYKELYEKKMLTINQLNYLLNRIES